MLDLLIYLRKEVYQEEIERVFPETMYQVSLATDMEQVVQQCQENLFDLTLVWAENYDEIADFLTVLSIHKLDFLPVIAVLTSEAEWPAVLTLPIADYVILPVSRVEFFAKIRHVLQDLDVQSTVLEGMNWQGSLQEYNLIDLIQMVESGQKDAVLIMNYGEKQGELLFRQGKLIQAGYQGLTALAAVFKLGFWSQGNFQIRFSRLPSVEVQIKESNQEVLIQLIQKLAEQERLMEELPSYFDEMVVNPLVQPNHLTPIQQRIKEFAARPITLFELLISLPEDDRDILKALKEMLERGWIGRRQEVEQWIIEEERKSSLSKLFSSISSIFKRRQEIHYQEIMAEETEVELRIPRLVVKRPHWTEENRARLQQALGEVK